MHSVTEIARNNYIPPHYEHPSIVLCGVDNEFKLKQKFEYFTSLGIICLPFRESDLDNEMTSFATRPVLENERRLFKKLQLIKSEDFYEK